MKLFQLLPEGAAGVLAKAARTQREQTAQALADRVKREISERRQYWERSLLGAIDEYAAKGNRAKVTQLIRLYTATYPHSVVKAEVEAVRLWAISSPKPAGQLTRQGLTRIDRLPAAWSRA